jgi:hypothetical protein
LLDGLDRHGATGRDRRGLTRSCGAVFALLLLAIGALGLFALPGVAAAANYPTLSGTIHGPSTVGTGLKNEYHLTATGGPGFGLNGTQIGFLSFSVNVLGTNTTGVQLLPTAGVFFNGVANLNLTTSNVTQTLTVNVEVKSGYHGVNATTNLTYVVQVVQPYRVSALLVVQSGLGTIPFAVAVLLDGNAVGSVQVPSLTGHSTFQVTYSYVNPSLAPGWHTFTLSLPDRNGLVQFAHGGPQFSHNFYVAAPATNNSIWYVTAVVAFFGAIFIWLTAVGARRRGRKR